MADYYNYDTDQDLVNVTHAVGRRSSSGPAPNLPTDLMLVYFFLYRLYTYPTPRILVNRKIASLIHTDPRVTNWADPKLPKRVGDAILEYQRCEPDMYADGRIDRADADLRTPRTQKTYTIVCLQCDYIRLSPLRSKSIGEIMTADNLLPYALREELFGDF